MRKKSKFIQGKSAIYSACCASGKNDTNKTFFQRKLIDYYLFIIIYNCH